MRITQISLQNFKGHTGTYRLDPVTLIVGSNFSHKTSIPLAARLAMAGKLPPPIGTKGIYQLAGDSTGVGLMAINLVFDNGRQVAWNWARDAAGRVTTKGGLTEDITMPELLLDPRLFFAKTAADQVSTIFQACDIEHFSTEKIVNRLSEIHEPPLVECEAVLDEITKWIRTKTLDVSPPVWIEMLFDWLNTERKSASDQLKVASGAFAGLQSTGPQIATDPTDELNKAMSVLQQLRQGVPNTADLEREIGQVQAKLTGRRFLNPAGYNAEIAKIAIPKISIEPEEVDSVCDELCANVIGYNEQLKLMESRISEYKNLATQIETHESCPTCGQSKKGWKTAPLKRIAETSSSLVTQYEALVAKQKVESQQLNVLVEWKAKQKQIGNLTKEREIVEGAIAAIKNIESLIETRKAALFGDSTKIAEAEQRVSKLQADLAAFGAYQRDRARREDFEKRLLAMNCRIEVFKATIAIVQEEQTKLINEAFAQVLEVAKMFTVGLLNSPLEFVDGRLGRRVSAKDQRGGNRAPLGSWIPFEAFSGTEELLALAGFGVALTKDAPVKLVILDEMGRMDPDRKVDVAHRMIALAQNGSIDQSILIDVSEENYPEPRPGVFGVITL